MLKVKLLKYNNISFQEVENSISKNNLNEIEKWWNDYSKDKSFLFDGDIIAIKNVVKNNDKVNIEWFKSKYSHYLQKIIEPARIVYCSVLIMTKEGKLLVVKTSKQTATNGKIMLPGGNIELENGNLNIAICKKNALRELEEEVGIKLETNDIDIWRVKEGGNGNELGLFFKSKRIFKEETINSIFKKHLSTLKNNKYSSEIEKIYFFDSKEDINENKNVVDYLEEVLNEKIKEEK